MIEKIKQKLESGRPTIGSWMQILSASVAEIMGRAGYDWVAVDVISEYISVLKYRHWLAHGRYWIPKLGRKSFSASLNRVEVLNAYRFNKIPGFHI